MEWILVHHFPTPGVSLASFVFSLSLIFLSLSLSRRCSLQQTRRALPAKLPQALPRRIPPSSSSSSLRRCLGNSSDSLFPVPRELRCLSEASPPEETDGRNCLASEELTKEKRRNEDVLLKKRSADFMKKMSEIEEDINRSAVQAGRRLKGGGPSEGFSAHEESGSRFFLYQARLSHEGVRRRNNSQTSREAERSGKDSEHIHYLQLLLAQETDRQTESRYCTLDCCIYTSRQSVSVCMRCA